MTSSTQPDHPLDIRVVTAEQTHPLRAAILRPDRPPDQTVFPGDGAQDALHLGAYDGPEIVGTVTIMRQPPEDYTGDHPELLWRLRGMATSPQVRRRGYGAALVLAGCAYVAGKGGAWLWCDARLSAVGFYQKLGFEIRGDLYERPVTGPHYRMWQAITAADAS